ncbi:MAG TPA: PA2779 family protein [Mariprofundaceae bacterium]|nr:PA2779 family protein [Mariprofundaceae bacterium]
MKRRIKNSFCQLLIFSIVCLGLPVMPAQAAMVGTAETLHASAATPERAKLDAFLARADVQQQLLQLGVSPAEVKMRVAALTDDEVAKFNAKFDQLHPGGDVVGAVLGAALVIFLVLLLTDILGFTNVFGFVKHPKR